jgi:hypothetical protein
LQENRNFHKFLRIIGVLELKSSSTLAKYKNKQGRAQIVTKQPAKKRLLKLTIIFIVSDNEDDFRKLFT